MHNKLAIKFILSFVALILTGTALLYGWGFSHSFAGDRFMTSIFTATSAVCVTGLTIADLSHDFSLFGQIVVLLLIQLGGLGLLTISNWIMLSVRGRLESTGTLMTYETMGSVHKLKPYEFLKKIVIFTVFFELFGAIVLLVRFSTGHSFGYAAYLAVFHSISAFCNAGFSLFSDSLMSYRHDLWINLTVISLIIAGGIGFVAAIDIIEFIKGLLHSNRRFLSLHTRVVLATSTILILGGTLFFLIFEWENLAYGESFAYKVLESVFLSVTARTAGFNTIPTGHLTNMSLLVLISLMVVGASPGSTGGGVKTSTIAIIVAMIRSHVFNRPRPEIFHRSIRYDALAKAIAIVVMYVSVVFWAMVVLQASEFGELPHNQTRGLFLEQLFEVVSALSTVGLSTGITAGFGVVGKSVLIACMFIGRVGPLTIASSFIGERRSAPYQYPEGDIMIG